MHFLLKTPLLNILFFSANRFEDFCESVTGKRYCFRVDVIDHVKDVHLKGCLKLTRPRKIKIGCFLLPLMSSFHDVIDDVDMTSDEISMDTESESRDELFFEPTDF